MSGVSYDSSRESRSLSSVYDMPACGGAGWKLYEWKPNKGKEQVSRYSSNNVTHEARLRGHCQDSVMGVQPIAVQPVHR